MQSGFDDNLTRVLGAENVTEDNIWKSYFFRKERFKKSIVLQNASSIKLMESLVKLSMSPSAFFLCEIKADFKRKIFLSGMPVLK